jgi:hypothetical protein
MGTMSDNPVSEQTQIDHPSLVESPTLTPPVQPNRDKLTITQTILILGVVAAAAAFLLFALWMYVSA